MTKICTYQG